jgi:Sap, sulfolipid-1-addressing protein
VIGLLATGIAWVLRTRRDQPFQERRRVKKYAKLEAKREAGKPTESLPLRLLGKGDPKVTFVVGAILSFPGVSYLTAIHEMHTLNPGTIPTVLLNVGFCLIQQILLEVPLLGYVFAPDRTRDTIDVFKAWMGRKRRPAAVIGAAVIGVGLIARALSPWFSRSVGACEIFPTAARSRVEKAVQPPPADSCPSRRQPRQSCGRPRGLGPRSGRPSHVAALFHPVWVREPGLDGRSVRRKL